MGAMGGDMGGAPQGGMPGGDTGNMGGAPQGGMPSSMGTTSA